MSDTHEIPVFWVERRDDEDVLLSVGEKEVARLDHDTHGFAGMRSGENMFRKIAFAVGAQVKER